MSNQILRESFIDRRKIDLEAGADVSGSVARDRYTPPPPDPLYGSLGGFVQ